LKKMKGIFITFEGSEGCGKRYGGSSPDRLSPAQVHSSRTGMIHGSNDRHVLFSESDFSMAAYR